MFIKPIIQSRFIDIPILKSHKPHMQLIRNALDPHHIQRTHLNEMNCAFRCDFRYALRGSIDVLKVSLLPNYTQS